MIPARKSAWFARWFSGHAERRLRRTFGEVRIRGLEALRGALAQGPVLVVSNHTAWWDPLVALVLCERTLGADAYAMMDAVQLRALPFFAKVGAFGVALDDPADGARSIRYAARRLDRPGRLVWVFAQGREVPVTARPLDFRPGAAAVEHVARSARVVPVALRYEHGEAPRPAVWIAVGDAIARGDAPGARSTASLRAAQEAAVSRELERIDARLIAGTGDGFEVLFRSHDGFWARAAQAMLAWATRPRRLRSGAHGSRSTVP